MQPVGNNKASVLASTTDCAILMGRGHKGETGKIFKSPLYCPFHCFLCSKSSTVWLTVSGPTCKKLGRQCFYTHTGKVLAQKSTRQLRSSRKVMSHVTDLKMDSWVLSLEHYDSCCWRFSTALYDC